MVNIVVKLIKYVVIYSFAAFYGFFVSLFLFVKLCQLRAGFFKKRQGEQGSGIVDRKSGIARKD